MRRALGRKAVLRVGDHVFILGNGISTGSACHHGDLRAETIKGML